MISLLSLIGSTLFLSLRVSSGGGFPPPLTEEEEKLCLEGVARGDIEARNRLVEHNLRLVSHIIKKYYAAVNIPSRERLAQMRGYMPARYWKFLPETQTFSSISDPQ